VLLFIKFEEVERKLGAAAGAAALEPAMRAPSTSTGLGFAHFASSMSPHAPPGRAPHRHSVLQPQAA